MNNLFLRIKHAISRIPSKIYSTIFLLITKLFQLLELFLFLRLTLKFLGANQKALVVAFIYEYTNPFVSPFYFIFSDIYLPEGYLIDTATLSAIIGYAILVYVIFQFLKLFSKDYFP
ncbi:hypothetical protein AMJ49_01255 [Parcubacteria bacterium DG_74_2]|nr:MAG: hypothetical protein AMJ49_01255 [Parcubacteria bacterium DG_74_2]